MKSTLIRVFPFIFIFISSLASAAVINYTYSGLISTVDCHLSGFGDCGALAVGDSVTGTLSIDFGIEDGNDDAFGDAELLSYSLSFHGDGFTPTIEPGVSGDSYDGPISGGTTSLGQLSSLSINTIFGGGSRITGIILGSGSLEHGGTAASITNIDFTTFDGTWTKTSAVPVPAAVWLFGSGLIGLIGVARRKKT